MILASNMNDLSPHFLPIMDSKMSHYPPNMGKMGNFPQKRDKNLGDEEFVLYIHI